MEVTPMQCKAMGRNGRQCGSHAVRGRDVCRMHGGAPGSGGDGRPLIHGLYSKRVPKGWEQDYEDFKCNPDILCAIPEIALARTHLARWLAYVGSVADETPEMIATGLEHLDKVTKLQERESKRLSNERVVNEMIACQVHEEMNVLRELLARNCDPVTAHRILEEFVRRVGATPEDEIESGSAMPPTHAVRVAPA